MLINEVAQSTQQLLAGKERMLIIDEVGQPKKGDNSVAVARQYCGNQGKVDNCQVSVAGYLTDFRKGSLIDMQLYIPQSWTCNLVRMKKAGLPPTAYRTKLEIAGEMVKKQIRQNIDFQWVVADGYYGRDLSFGCSIDQQGKKYLLEVPCNRKVYLEKPTLRIPGKKEGRGRKPIRKRPDQLSIPLKDYCQSLTLKAFNKTRIRDTVKGNLITQVHTRMVWVWDKENDRTVKVRLLIRKDKNKVSFAFSNACDNTEKQLLKVQAWRYFIERSFQEAKNVVGMKHYQVRKYQAWIHYMAMILLLLVFLMNQREKFEKLVHQFFTYRDIKLCFQHYLPHKMDTKHGFLDRLFDNLETKKLDYDHYDHFV